MSKLIQKGPNDTNTQIPHKSLGIIFYNVLKNLDETQTLIVESTGEEINCGKFFRVSVNLAKTMKILGVKKGDVVTVISYNQWKYLATVVAGLYIGAKMNLLNPDYSPGELKPILETCKPVLIFCISKCIENLGKLQNGSGNIIIFDDEFSNSQFKSFKRLLEDVDHENFEPVELDPESDVAFLLTSSGTTGLPKCVQITHSNFRITMVYITDPHFIDMNKNEVLLGFLPFFHILGKSIALTTLVSGAKLIILDKFAPDRFLQAIETYKVTKLFTVPSVLLFLTKNPLIPKYDLSSINDILCSSAPVTKELEQMVENKLNVTTVRQIYGMTEMCGAVTITPKHSKRYGSVGTVTTAHEVKICDPKTEDNLSANQLGELRFKGKGLMKGYLGNNVETKNAFDYEGYLKSGDLGYYDTEGYFYIVGRIKEIIRYKGFQVSPVELESLLIQHDAVKDAGVIGIPDEKAGEVPMAFVVKQPNKAVTEKELVQYITEHISSQKQLRGGVRFVNEIPKNPSGKILRRKLKELL